MSGPTTAVFHEGCDRYVCHVYADGSTDCGEPGQCLGCPACGSPVVRVHRTVNPCADYANCADCGEFWWT